jgi:hypothetical protein
VIVRAKHASPPAITVTNRSELILSEDVFPENDNDSAANQAYDRKIAKIQDCLKTLAADFESLKLELRQSARRLIEARQAKIKKDDDFDKGMGIPRRTIA